jgi:hypothetical protein
MEYKDNLKAENFDLVYMPINSTDNLNELPDSFMMDIIENTRSVERLIDLYDHILQNKP